MIAPTRPRGRRWTLDEWSDFGRRARGLISRLDGFLRGFPETKGLAAVDLNLWRKVRDQVVSAMIGCENEVCRIDPDASLNKVLHGARGTSVWAPIRGRVRRDAPILSREEWERWGREARAIRDEVGALYMSLSASIGVSHPASKRLERAVRSGGQLSRALSAFDRIVCEQHPDWDDFCNVFFGR